MVPLALSRLRARHAPRSVLVVVSCPCPPALVVILHLTARRPAILLHVQLLDVVMVLVYYYVLFSWIPAATARRHGSVHRSVLLPVLDMVRDLRGKHYTWGRLWLVRVTIQKVEEVPHLRWHQVENGFPLAPRHVRQRGLALDVRVNELLAIQVKCLPQQLLLPVN